MNNPRKIDLPWVARRLVAVILLLVVVAASASACPSCKETIAGDNGSLATGLSYSVLGMMSMPFLLVALVSGIVVRAYRSARQRGGGEDPI